LKLRRKSMLDRRKARIVGFMAASALALSAQAPASPGPSDADLVGIWSGALKIQGQSLALVFNIAVDKGKLAATMDSPDQGAKGIPVSAIALDGEKVRIESKAVRGVFAGELSADRLKIEGTWSQGTAAFPLVVEKVKAAPARLRPQEPKAPFPYKTEEVVVVNKKAGVKLAGTLVVPKAAAAAGAATAAQFPAVVFVTGSGAQNRDEEILGHKPFLVIADYLARRGIASLRCDDRGYGKSTGDATTATTLDFADDAEAAFEFLRSRGEINKDEVGIIGHSEGGLIAPIVASRNASVAFIVLLAAPGMRGEELILAQGALIARAAGASEAEIAEGQEVNRRLYAAVKGAADAASAKAAAEKAYLAWIDSSAGMGEAEKGQARKMAGDLASQAASPWFRAFLTLDPAPYLAKVGVPVLALNGSKDLQVPADADLAGIEASLGKALGSSLSGGAKGPSPKSAFVKLEGLNHLFQHAASGAPDEYGTIEESFAPEALKAIGDWILGL
jgi:pimeloyl-ACP methyl ester carboxylesterase